MDTDQTKTEKLFTYIWGAAKTSWHHLYLRCKQFDGNALWWFKFVVAHVTVVFREADPLDGHLDHDDDDEEEDLARWVHIQKEAFTNWCNDKLKSRDMSIKDVKYDFRSDTSLWMELGLFPFTDISWFRFIIIDLSQLCGRSGYFSEENGNFGLWNWLKYQDGNKSTDLW